MSNDAFVRRGESRGPAGAARSLGILTTLYFVQGLPFGFQASALPLYLRVEGVSLATLGYLSALASPWLLKALWAPLVDRTAPGGLGRRKRWIVPMQVGLGLSLLGGGFLDVRTALPWLLALVFLANLFAATMDIAVDGLAVDLLRDGELGLGNAAQVAGYKLGMMTSGGLLVYLSRDLGFQAVFVGMAVLVGLALVATLAFREPPTPVPTIHGAPIDLRAAVARVAAALAEPSGRYLVFLVVFYKAGEAMADVMLRPMLVDRGFAPHDLGLWLSTYGTAASLVGSLVGGALATRYRLLPLLFGVAALRVLPLGLELSIALGENRELVVIAIAVVEHLVGGMLTTVVFAFMMSSVDPRVGATHYTVLAAFENLGKGITSFWAGALAERLGYASLFGLALAISLLFLGLYLPMARLAASGAYVRPSPS